MGLTGDPAKRIHGDSKQNVATIAYKNEYGVGVPERPFMRITVARERRAWLAMAAQVVQGQAKGASTVERGLRRMGLRMAADHKRTIRETVPPPNAPSTIQRKGSSKPLVDTGQMLNSIRAEVVLPDGTTELIG